MPFGVTVSVCCPSSPAGSAEHPNIHNNRPLDPYFWLSGEHGLSDLIDLGKEACHSHLTKICGCDDMLKTKKSYTT